MTTPSFTDYYWTNEITCDGCQETFDDQDEFQEHLSTSYNHRYCQRCNLDFEDQPSLDNHFHHSSSHHVCGICSIDFDYSGELDHHLRTEHWSCFMCGMAFSTENLLLNHQTSSHPYCATHRRAFRNYHDLNQHLNSSAHLPSNIELVRVQIDNQVAQFDRQNLITNNTTASSGRPPSRRITSGSSSSNRYSPYSNTRSTPVVSNLATNASWNPSTQSFECFFCHSLFSSLSALNQHLSSPRHQYETFRQLPTNKLLYKCPNSNCTRNFLALSGLVQHVEFGHCGVRQFRGVMNTIENVMGGMKRIGN
ncbi:hypothetical protein JCM5350_002191 [Sporobolomyces pararoseus]